MLYPLFIVLISSTYRFLYKNTKLKILFIGLLIWCIIEAVIIYPHYFVYFNQFIGGPKNGYKYVSDSNLDWNQDDEIAAEFIKYNPDVIVNPDEPTTGRVLIKGFKLAYAQEDYWIYKIKKKPIGYINYSWIMFDIEKEDLDVIKEVNIK